MTVRKENPIEAARLHPPVGFVGRRRELSEIYGLLSDPNCRLLTLVGPGGIGKTRLAMEAAAQVRSHFAGGAVMVALQDVSTRLALVTALARALHCNLAGTHDPLSQLLSFLAEKEMLLLLDNLEQLVENAEVVAAMLAAAPGVKVLATSREMLNLSDEWLYPVDALSFPAGSALPNETPSNETPSDKTAQNETASLESYDAVRLFAERARRVRMDFSLEAEAPGVVRICRLAGGMPLAIELAAAWLKTLSCAEIADEIQASLDFLSTNRRDVAPRHRSIRAACDHSWQRLSAAEQQVFMILALFHGGFQRRAAEDVAGATLPILSTLVEKSLLRWQPKTRRYQMHELLRQYALEQLNEQDDVLAQARARHCTYYGAFLHSQGEAMLKGEQQAPVAAIEVELNNIRAAWQWAVGEADSDALIRMAPTLIDYFQIRSRYVEGAQLLAGATARLRDTLQPPTASQSPGAMAALALLLTYQGSLYIRLGRIDAAENHLKEAQSCYAQCKLAPMPGYNTDPAFSLGIIALIRGEYTEAARLGGQVLETSERHDHPQNRQLAHYLLACAASAQGELAAAQRHAEEAYTLARATASQWFMAYCLNELGNIAFALGDYSAAHRHYSESYAIRQGFGDPEGMALALVRLGEIALVQEGYAEARLLCEKGRALYQQIGDQGGLASALAGLGRAAVGLREWKAAREFLQEALTLALALHYQPYIGASLYAAALLLIATRETAQGVRLLAALAHHPGTPRPLLMQVQSRLSDDLSYLGPGFLAAARRMDQVVDFETLAHETLATLQQPLASGLPSMQVVGTSPPLVEPLSERERQLLRHMAAGLKNREIAEAMVISVNTVKVHINNIYGKLGVSSRIQAIARARELALL